MPYLVQLVAGYPCQGFISFSEFITKDPRYLKSSTCFMLLPANDLKLLFGVEEITSVLVSLQWSPTRLAASSTEWRRASAFVIRSETRAMSSAKSKSVMCVAGCLLLRRGWTCRPLSLIVSNERRRT